MNTFPANNMSGNSVSHTAGFNIDANVGANVGSPQASGLNVGLSGGYNDSTTATAANSDFNVSVVREPTQANSRSFHWDLCAWGTQLTDCYTSGTDLLEDFLGGKKGNLIALPASAWRIDGFKNDVYYQITDAKAKKDLATAPFRIDITYTIHTDQVQPASDNGGVTLYGKTKSLTYSEKMTYDLDLSKLAYIMANAPKFN
jgi:hypothetical protein